MFCWEAPKIKVAVRIIKLQKWKRKQLVGLISIHIPIIHAGCSKQMAGLYSAFCGSRREASFTLCFFVIIFIILVVHWSEFVGKYVAQIIGIPSVFLLKWVKWHQEESWPNMFCFGFNHKILLGTDQFFFKQDCSRLNKSSTNQTMQGLLVLDTVIEEV